MRAPTLLVTPFVLVAIGSATACGERASSGETSSGESSTSEGEPPPGSSGADSSSGASAEVTSSDAASTSTSTAAASSDDTDESGPEPEVYDPQCDVPATSIVVHTAEGPDGPLNIDYAWLGHAACYGTPYVALVEQPRPGESPRRVAVRMDVEEGVEPPWTGTFPAYFAFSPDEPVGTIELLEPLEWSDAYPDPPPDHRMHARIEVHARGWNVSVEVDLVHCGTAECFCPCE